MKLNKTIIAGLILIVFAGLIFVTDIFTPIIRPVTYLFLMGSSKGKDIIFFGLLGLFLILSQIIIWLIAVNNSLKDSKLFVYTPLTLDKESLLGPRDLSSIPYYNCVEELWYLKSCRFKLVGEIKVENIKETKTYHYGPRQTIGNVYIWNWKEILKPWERKKIV